MAPDWWRERLANRCMISVVGGDGVKEPCGSTDSKLVMLNDRERMVCGWHRFSMELRPVSHEVAIVRSVRIGGNDGT